MRSQPISVRTVLPATIAVLVLAFTGMAFALGTTTAFIGKQPSHAGVSIDWRSNTVGWSRQNLTLTCTLYHDGVEFGSDHNSCNNSTSCTTPNNVSFFADEGTWTVIAKGCGTNGCTTDSKSVSA